MVNLLRSARNLVCIALLANPSEVQSQDTSLDSFQDIPQLTMGTLDDGVARGLTLVYVYGSHPKANAVLRIEWANKTFYDAVTSPAFPDVDFYKFDVQPLVPYFGSRHAAQPYLEETFQAYDSPTLVFFCNGEIKRSVSPFLPKLDQTNLSFTNPKNVVAAQRSSDVVIKATIQYAAECK